MTAIPTFVLFPLSYCFSHSVYTFHC